MLQQYIQSISAGHEDNLKLQAVFGQQRALKELVCVHRVCEALIQGNYRTH